MKFGFALALATAANAASDWTSRPGLPDFAKGFQSPSRYVDRHMDHDDHHDDHDDDHHYSPSGFGSGKWNNYGSRSSSSYKREEPKPQPKQHSYNNSYKQEARPLYNQPKFDYDADRYNGYSQHKAPSHVHQQSHSHSYQAPKPTYEAPKPMYQAPKPQYQAPAPQHGYQRQNSYQAATGQQNMGHGYQAPMQHGYQAPKPQYQAPMHHGYQAPMQHGHQQSQHTDGYIFFNTLDQLERQLDEANMLFNTLRSTLITKEGLAGL